MRNLFPGYYRFGDTELKALWANATFVFDTNVLLNLYSYPEIPRKAFFAALEKVSKNTWIPYHVALEFHRQKFNKIKQSSKKLNDLLKKLNTNSEIVKNEIDSIELEKWNIGIADIQSLVVGLQEAHKKLSDAVALACERLPPVGLNDEIGERICSLFEGRVGLPPADQAALDAMLKGAQERYDSQTPPGYKDEKEKGDKKFVDRGITYLNKFGDLIIWKQIIAHASRSSIKDLIFITGDVKEDWWWREDGKTIAPQTELTYEIMSDGHVDRFWMYTADQFLAHSQEILNVSAVTEEVITQIKNINESNELDSSADLENALLNMYTQINKNIDSIDIFKYSTQEFNEHLTEPRSDLFMYKHRSAERSVYIWLRAQYGDSVSPNKRFPDFVVDVGRSLVGYEVKTITSLSSIRHVTLGFVAKQRQYFDQNKNDLDKLYLVIVLYGFSEEKMDSYRDYILNIMESRRSIFDDIGFIFGLMVGSAFRPILIIGNN